MGLTSSSSSKCKLSLKLNQTIQNTQTLVFLIQLLTDGRLALCCENSIINIFNLVTNKIDIKIEDKENQIYIDMNTLSNNRIILSSAQGKIIIYKIKKDHYHLHQVIDTLTNSWLMKSIEIRDNRICCISRNNKILFFEGSKPYRQKRTIETKERINSIYRVNRKDILLCFSIHNILLFLDLNNYSFIATINNIDCYSRRSIIELNDERVLIGGENKITVIYNYQIHTIIVDNEISKIESFLVLDEHRVIIGSGNDTRGKLPCLDTDKYIIFYRHNTSHKLNIDSLVKIKEGIFASGSFDHKVNIWEYE